MKINSYPGRLYVLTCYIFYFRYTYLNYWFNKKDKEVCLHIDFCLYQFKILHQVNSHRIKWILWLGPQKSVSDTPIESKKFRRLDEIFKKFSTNKKFIWVIFGLAMVLTKKTRWRLGVARRLSDVFPRYFPLEINLSLRKDMNFDDWAGRIDHFQPYSCGKKVVCWSVLRLKGQLHHFNDLLCPRAWQRAHGKIK